MISKLRIAARSSTPVDIVQQLNFLTFDLIGELCFSSPMGCLSKQSAPSWVRGFFRAIRGRTVLAQVAAIKVLAPLFLVLSGPLMRSGIELFAYGRKKVEERIRNGSNKTDFMGKVLENMDGQDKERGYMTRDEVQATFNVLLIAGSETTATALSGATYLLGHNPSILKQLQDEVRGSVSSGDELTIAKINTMPYLFAVLEETLRIYPPVPIGLQRVAPPEGATICGKFVPGGVCSLSF